MKTFLLIGDDRYFYEALKKQIELNERFLLEFAGPSKAVSRFTQIEECSLVFVDMPSLHNERLIDYGRVKTMCDDTLMACTKKECHIRHSVSNRMQITKPNDKKTNMNRRTEDRDE